MTMKFSSTLATATLAAFATSAQANDIESYPTTNQAKCMLMAAQAGVESFAEVQAFRDSSNGTDTDIVKAHVIENMDGLTVSMRDNPKDLYPACVRERFHQRRSRIRLDRAQRPS